MTQAAPSNHPSIIKKAFLHTGRTIRLLRRWLAKALEPKKPEPNPMWDIPIKASIRAAQALRTILTITEQDYLFISSHSFEDCRSFLLYGVLDEVMKVAIYLMRLQEFFDGPKVSPGEDLASRLTTMHIIEELHARERRLLEVLITLAMFETTNEQHYYRHFLLLEDLDSHITANNDLKEFFGARSSNIDLTIRRTIEEIRSIERSTDPAKLWYRHPNFRKSIPDQGHLVPGRILSSYRHRLKSALPLMSDSEKILIGLSYAGYVQKSESMHFQCGPRSFDLSESNELSNPYLLGLLNFAVLIRCHRLSGCPEIPLIHQLADAIERPNWQVPFKQLTERDIFVGDFVLAYGDLAEVLEIRESPYKYRSYKVRYLAEKPIVEIQEDYFPAYYVQPFYKKTRFLDTLKQMAQQGKIPQGIADNIEGFTKEQVQTIIRTSLVETWKLGLKAWVKGHQIKRKMEKR